MAVNIPDQPVIEAIKTILRTIPGVGNVYDQIPYVTNQKDVQDRLVHNGFINTVGFTEVTRKVIKTDGGFALETIEKKFSFVYYRSFNFGSNSDHTVRVFADNMCDLFNRNMTLNDTISEHGKMDLTGNFIRAFSDVLCHLLNFEITTYENQNNSLNLM